MSGVVVETEFGEFEFPLAWSWDDDPDSGVLDILDEDDRYLGSFNRGCWWSVRSVENVELPQSLDDIHDFVWEDEE